MSTVITSMAFSLSDAFRTYALCVPEYVCGWLRAGLFFSHPRIGQCCRHLVNGYRNGRRADATDVILPTHPPRMNRGQTASPKKYMYFAAHFHPGNAVF